MKPFIKQICLVCLIVLMPAALYALEVPPQPDGYVTDRVGLFKPSEKNQLEQILRSYEQQTSNQIVVAIFKSLEEESLEDFSIRLAEAWKVGQKDKENGVIFLIFIEDKALRLEVGYGLEGVLTDALSGQIIHQVVIPQFAKGQYQEGIIAGVSAIMRAIQGEYQASADSSKTQGYNAAQIEEWSRQGARLFKVALFVILIVFLVDLGRFLFYRKKHRSYNKRYNFWEWWFRFAILLFIFSLLFRILFYSLLFSRGGSYGSRGGFGGFSGGGGGFGGGGASGRW